MSRTFNGSIAAVKILEIYGFASHEYISKLSIMFPKWSRNNVEGNNDWLANS